MTVPDLHGPPGLDLPAMRDRLIEQRAALFDARSVSAESRSPVVLDQSSVGRLSRMDAMQQQAMALATERRRAVALTRIDAAIARIAAGDYGWCVQCGEAITPKRLALDPAVPTCIGCAGNPKA